MIITRIRIQEILHAEYADTFLGREKELELLRTHLKPGSDWKLIHLHGIGGIGKSTLLRRLAHEIGWERSLFFDGHSGYRQPEDWLRALSTALTRLGVGDALGDAAAPLDLTTLTDRLNEAAAEEGWILLLLDTFEQWSPIEEWLRTEFLPRLLPQVRVVSAGRYPLAGAWERGAWRRLVLNMKLSPFSAADTDAYIRSNGITDPALREQLRVSTGGFPLALCMAVEIVSRKSDPQFLNLAEHERTINDLVAELLSDLHPPAFQRYLDAASVIWHFDQEWLQLLLGEVVPADAFRDFCRLPFVVSYGSSWGLHDSIRNWTRSDLLRRMPQTLESYRLKALEELRRREESTPGAKGIYALDKLYLHNNDLVRYYCFSGDVEGLLFHPLEREEDLDRSQEIYVTYARHTGIGDSFLTLLKPLWQAEPSGFWGAWREGRLVAFYVFLPLNDQIVPILRAHPVTAPYLTRSDRVPKEYVLLCQGIDPGLEELEGALARHMAYQFNRAELVFDLSPFPEWHAVLESIGFEPIPWANSVGPDGHRYTTFLLDLRTEDFATKIDRNFSGARPVAPVPLAPLEPEAKISLVKSLLQQYARLGAQPELIGSIGPYLDGYAQARQPAERLRLIQERVGNALILLEDGDFADVRTANLIRMAYIKKIGTHELVAERLNLPIATYYRLLKRGVERLADLLFGG